MPDTGQSPSEHEGSLHSYLNEEGGQDWLMSSGVGQLAVLMGYKTDAELDPGRGGGWKPTYETNAPLNNGPSTANVDPAHDNQRPPASEPSAPAGGNTSLDNANFDDGHQWQWTPTTDGGHVTASSGNQPSDAFTNLDGVISDIETSLDAQFDEDFPDEDEVSQEAEEAEDDGDEAAESSSSSGSGLPGWLVPAGIAAAIVVAVFAFLALRSSSAPAPRATSAAASTAAAASGESARGALTGIYRGTLAGSLLTPACGGSNTSFDTTLNVTAVGRADLRVAPLADFPAATIDANGLLDGGKAQAGVFTITMQLVQQAPSALQVSSGTLGTNVGITGANNCSWGLTGTLTTR